MIASESPGICCFFISYLMYLSTLAEMSSCATPGVTNRNMIPADATSKHAGIVATIGILLNSFLCIVHSSTFYVGVSYFGGHQCRLEYERHDYVKWIIEIKTEPGKLGSSPAQILR